MHICFLSSYFPQPCGIASYTHYLAEALCIQDKNLQVTVLAEQTPQEQPMAGFKVCGTFDRDDDYRDQLLARIKRLAPDVLHIQHEYGIFGYDNRFIDLLRNLKRIGIKVVVTLHTVHSKMSFHTGCTRPHLRQLLRRTDIEQYQFEIGSLAHCIIVHQPGINQVLQRQGIVANKIKTIAHGTRLLTMETDTAKKRLGIPAGTPLVMSFGYFEIAKNIHLLIQAFSKIKKNVPDALLWLNGYMRVPTAATLQYRERCLKLIKGLSLQDAVVFKNDWLTEEELPALVAAADIACFVYNEDTRSASGALHLAMGLGKSVVAARISKFEELSKVSDEILVNPSSPAELSQLLTRLLLDKPFEAYINRSILAYAQETAWDAVARQHTRMYESFFLQKANLPRELAAMA